MIIRGGENIFPAEIENFLHTHPKVANVQVIGIPDDKLGEVVVAWIRLHAGEVSTPEEIRGVSAAANCLLQVARRVSWLRASR